MWFNDDDNGCDDASDGYVDVVSDAIYVFSLLAGIAVLAVMNNRSCPLSPKVTLAVQSCGTSMCSICLPALSNTVTPLPVR